MVWLWHARIMSSASITALLESTDARTRQPSTVTICIAWDFLQEIHAVARRDGFLSLPLTTECLFSICFIPFTMLLV